MADALLLSVRDLKKSLAAREVLHGISLELQRGEFLGLIGPNGAGKTTLLRCMTGQWTVTENSVLIDGIDITADAMSAKRRFGYAFEPADLLERLTGRQHMRFIAGVRNLPDPESEIRALADLVDLSADLDAEIATYSFGMKQKLSIMMALIGNPPLVILDEALNGLDPVSSYRIKNHLKELAATGRVGILLASHMLESLERYCTRIAMIRDGRIFRRWTREELEAEGRASGRNLEDLFVEIMNDGQPATVS